MKCAIITVAGISSRFNEGLQEEQHALKAVYSSDGNARHTLLWHLLEKCVYADEIVIVGGYRFADLEQYLDRVSGAREQEAGGIERKRRIRLVYNDRFTDLASGCSLHLGIKAALEDGATEILFAEGDLDVDDASFARVVHAKESVLTYTREPVYADKAVVVYQNAEGKFRYAFNASHGLLRIDEPFSCLLNSGQVWKFTDMEALRAANEAFQQEAPDGTNLYIIQRYFDTVAASEPVLLEQWTNCNTREDYAKILSRWVQQEM